MLLIKVLYFLYKSLDHPSLFRLQSSFRFTTSHDYLVTAFQTMTVV